MEKDGFHPHTQSKGVRKSRDQQAKTKGIRLKRTNQATLDSRLLSHHFGSNDIDAKGDREYVINFSDRGYDLITNRMIDNFENNYPEVLFEIIPKDRIIKINFNPTEKERLNKLIRQSNDINRVANKGKPKIQQIPMLKERKARDEELQPFVKKNIAENLAEVNLFIRDLREEKAMRMREGKSVGIINTDLRLIGGARSSILSLLEQVPEPLHREIVMESSRIETEMKS